MLGSEVASIYYIMPFPGSQNQQSVELAYFIVSKLMVFRLVALLLLAYPVYYFIARGSTTHKVLLIAFSLLYLMVYYQVNHRMRADAMFKQPRVVSLLTADSSQVDKKQLILGIALKGQARAYPIEVIGYHHQVRDTVAGEPVMITYCTVCRTGRVYKPVVKDEPETFRLVGMEQFNAMFEDSRTRSWWRQATGEAVAGPLKGSLLEEIPSMQMSLRAWIDLYPNTLILQPDSSFKEPYKVLEHFDEGTIESSLERRDSLSWQNKSWIVGVQLQSEAKAYDWNDLLRLRVINDRVSTVNLLLTVEGDSATFHVWNRDSLQFELAGGALRDRQTQSVWNWRGQCIEGKLAGARLAYVQSYQEFWHAWQTFHAHTQKYLPPEHE
ncbi:MAG: DUF3179 domain-containing protein [Cytophagales bacterium]|nr:DUF3179 domain-containing protein [Cytophagales bacterium]